MVTKHFLKVVFVFSLMIILGIIGVVFVNYLDKKQDINSSEVGEVAN